MRSIIPPTLFFAVHSGQREFQWIQNEGVACPLFSLYRNLHTPQPSHWLHSNFVPSSRISASNPPPSPRVLVTSTVHRHMVVHVVVCHLFISHLKNRHARHVSLARKHKAAHSAQNARGLLERVLSEMHCTTRRGVVQGVGARRVGSVRRVVQCRTRRRGPTRRGCTTRRTVSYKVSYSTNTVRHSTT